jgi:hypothetical protein
MYLHECFIDIGRDRNTQVSNYNTVKPRYRSRIEHVKLNKCVTTKTIDIGIRTRLGVYKYSLILRHLLKYSFQQMVPRRSAVCPMGTMGIREKTIFIVLATT